MTEENQGSIEANNNQGKYQLRKESLPIAKNEDVEFSKELADEDDLEAVDRAEAADQRQQSNQ